jgi:hypothetical protein
MLINPYFWKFRQYDPAGKQEVNAYQTLLLESFVNITQLENSKLMLIKPYF